MHDTTDLNLTLLDTSRAPLTGLMGEHESTFFNSSVALNPLVAAASPLISIASGNLTCPDVATLENEVRAFEHRAHKNGFSSQKILAARYLLCAFVDELQSTQLLEHFQHENWGGERFFVILERSCEEPNQYIDLLELGYLCLSLGYQGRYRQSQDLHGLGRFIDQLYQVIQQQRGDINHRHLIFQLNKTQHTWRLPPWWLTLSASAILLLGVFIPYQHRLNASFNPLFVSLNQLYKHP
jgi:type VI secretion system protein ImpK